MLTSKEIREEFLKFFKEKKHKIVPSDSLIPSADPTILFTTAGMVQFKNFFLGKAKLKYTRAASCQKCFRTTDIDKVGHTVRHLTFFEMLGNFSFGDYFKKEAIPWSWELLTNDFALPEDKLYVSVYKDDDEAYQIWKKILPENKIYRLGEESNFWSVGPTGPCGPCSEIIYDLGENKGCGKPDCNPACDCDRWIEVWNLVFTQFDRDENGKLNPLPQKNIDTGMGLERLVMVCQGVNSCFETDLFRPIIDFTAQLFSIQLSNYLTIQQNSALRIIADHCRAISFLLADGVSPSNEGRGYVLRRIIRRALRQGKNLTQGTLRPFLYQLNGKVIELMSDTYPELKQKKEYIITVTKLEEEKFLETLDLGTKILEELTTNLLRQGRKIIPGKEVFRLYDTYGFPLELTREIAEERKLNIDFEGFNKASEESRLLARQSWQSGEINTETYLPLHKKFGDTSFRGYEFDEVTTKVVGIIKNGQSILETKEGEQIELILSETPFYAEAGGQIGDRGELRGARDEFQVEITNTQRPVEGLIVHKGKVIKGILKVGETVLAKVDKERRQATKRNHTATHLLHRALRQVLGEQVVQSGSLVAPERLRFDFTYPKGLTENELIKIEGIVNDAIPENYSILTSEITLTQAKEIGAMMLFGEKYGEKVRCVMITNAGWNTPKDAFSIELCGGTHCRATGEIGLFKILSETSIAAGVRRIEAITGRYANEYVRNLKKKLEQIAEKLSSSEEDIVNRLEKILQTLETREKQILSLKTRFLNTQIEEIISQAKNVKKVKVVSQYLEELDTKSLADFADKLKEKIKSGLVVLGSTRENKPLFVVSLTSDWVEKGLNAGLIAKEIGSLISGTGGGRKDFAQGGGKDSSKLKSALEKVPEIVSKLIT